MAHRPIPTAPAANNPLDRIGNVLLVASGKGGVGKSTVAANLAAAFAQLGHVTGLLDADIYGPSIPTMFGITDAKVHSKDGTMLEPAQVGGIRLMSMGFFVDPQAAMVWRGPMLNGAIMQFLQEVDWGDLDILVVDLPPGTGDVQLSLAQNLSHAAAVIVSTPQQVAIADVVRARGMFDRVGIPSVGLIENMSYFVCGDCSTEHDLFGRGGAHEAADALNLRFLGEVPLESPIRVAGDAGAPIVTAQPDSPTAQIFLTMAKELFEETAKWKQELVRRQSWSVTAQARGEVGPASALAESLELCSTSVKILVEQGMPTPGPDDHIDGGLSIAALCDRYALSLDQVLEEINQNLSAPAAKDKKGKLPILSR